MTSIERIAGLLFSGFAMKAYAAGGALWIACTVAGALARPLHEISATLAVLH